MARQIRIFQIVHCRLAGTIFRPAYPHIKLSGLKKTVHRFSSKIEIENFIERFYQFSDSVIRAITMCFVDGNTLELGIQIETRDAECDENNGWVRVDLTMHNVIEMAVREQRDSTIQVLSHGVNIIKVEGFLALEFGGEIGPLSRIDELRKSDAFAVAKSIAISVRTY